MSDIQEDIQVLRKEEQEQTKTEQNIKSKIQKIETEMRGSKVHGWDLLCKREQKWKRKNGRRNGERKMKGGKRKKMTEKMDEFNYEQEDRKQ